MKKLIVILSFVVACSVSCRKDIGPVVANQTLLLYMPWSTNLTSYFMQNIKDFETVLKGNILKNNRILVFLSSSATEATMFELKYERGRNVRTTLKEYTSPAFTTAEGITAILQDVIAFAPSEHYAMIVGSHGMGWLPVDRAPMQRRLSAGEEKYHWEYERRPMTRFFGGLAPDVQTEVTTLAEAIKNAGVKMDYILFDDCYMSTIEVAYDLKDVTDYLIACPTEIMAYGFPYHTVGKHLVGEVNLQGVVSEFYNFYKNYDYPYATIGVTVCAELDRLAVIMKEINQRFSFDRALLGSLQRMDGYSPVIFFDFGDYVRKLCPDNSLFNRFEAQLRRTVPPNLGRHTEYYYTAVTDGIIKINVFTGTTISDPSENTKAAAKTATAWYKATH